MAMPLKGAESALVETAAAPAELFWQAWNALGLPGGSQPGSATQTAKDLLMPGVEGRVTPKTLVTGKREGGLQAETQTEKVLEGAGRGAGEALSFAVPAAGVARAARVGSGIQRGAAALSAQPAAQTAIGAAAGGVSEGTDMPGAGLATAIGLPLAAGTARRIISPVRSSLTPQETRLVDAAGREGIDLTAGQRTGSKPMQAVESSLTQLPFSAGPQTRVYDRVRQQFNTAVLRRAGIQADRASPDVLDHGFQNLGQDFQRLAANTVVNVDRPLEAQVQRVATAYGRRLTADQAPVFNSYMDDLNQMFAVTRQPGVGRVTVDGQAFQNIHSDIAQRMRTTTDPDLRRALWQLNEALDQAMTRSMPPGTAAEWREARRQYSNLMRVDEAMRGGSQADRAAGNIPFGAFKQAVQKANTAGFSRGRGELNELARIADFLANKVPDSGTAARTRAMGMLTGAPVMGAGAGMGHMAGADPMTAMAAGAGSLGLPPAIQWLINSRYGRPYFANQVGHRLGTPVTPGLMGGVVGGQAMDPSLGYLRGE